MSRFIQVGVVAMRDPMTGEPLQAVPVYVDAEEAEQGLPGVNTTAIARAFIRKMKAQVEGTKTASCCNS